MDGRTPREALDEFTGALQRALSCVTRAVLAFDRDATSVVPHGLALGRLGESHRLRGVPFAFAIQQRYQIIQGSAEGRWNVRTTTYSYGLRAENGAPLLRYDWHPVGRSSFDTPHLGPASQAAPELLEHHLPTGRST